MIIIEVSSGEPIDKALRRYKRKHQQTKLMRELRDRREFTKPSIKRRHEKLHAIYIERRKVKMEI